MVFTASYLPLADNADRLGDVGADAPDVAMVKVDQDDVTDILQGALGDDELMLNVSEAIGRGQENEQYQESHISHVVHWI